MERSACIAATGACIGSALLMAYAQKDVKVTAGICLGLSASLLMALVIDEPVITELLGMGGLAKQVAPQCTCCGSKLVCTMWIAALTALASLLQLYQHPSATPGSQRTPLVTAFLSVTCCVCLLSFYARSRKWIIMSYFVALAVATTYLDEQLIPLVVAMGTVLAVLLSWTPVLSSRLVHGVAELTPVTTIPEDKVMPDSMTRVPVSDAACDSYKGAGAFSPARGAALLSSFLCACVLEWSSTEGMRLLQPLWSGILKFGSPYVQHTLFVVSITTGWFIFICAYFTALDLMHSKTTKVQKDYWPDPWTMWAAAWPQLLVYVGGNILLWVQWTRGWWHSAELPTSAPSLFELGSQLTLCLIVGDFFMYWEHRIMHAVPFLRNHIHSMHHEYTAPFSWAGGWVHPLEILIVVGLQVLPALAFASHPLTMWIFALFWTTCLIDEHSGHDVWWSPYQLLPFTGCPLGGGAAPHDIHHYKTFKNYSFIFIVWDRIFNSFEPVAPESCNPYVPPFNFQRRSKDMHHS